MCAVPCPLLALSGHPSLHRICPLSGVKRTHRFALRMSANDPKRTSLVAPHTSALSRTAQDQFPINEKQNMGYGQRARRGFTPEAIENIRHRYVDTEETQASIAKDFGVHRKTIEHLAQLQGWPPRRDRVARDLPAALKLRIEADRAVIAAVQETDEAAPLTVAERLERAAEKELAALERMRVTLGLEPSSPADAERTVRTIERLTETLFKVRRLRVPDEVANGEVAASDLPRDIDEFRHALAIRIETFVRGRIDGGIPAAGESGGTDPSQ